MSNSARVTPTVSVVIPCYNYGRFLADCVEGIVTQDGVDVRILIIDDASTDDSAAIAADIAAGDPRVDLVVHDRNKGHIATYNEGLLEWADGDYSVLISADDKLTPGSLQRATTVLEENPAVGFTYGAIRCTCGRTSRSRSPGRAPSRRRFGAAIPGSG